MTDADLIAAIRQVVREELALANRQPSPRGDPADLVLLDLLRRETAGQAFTGRQVFEIAALTPALAEALEDSCLDNPRQLGKLLTRFAGHAGLRRDDVGRAGISWRFE